MPISLWCAISSVAPRYVLAVSCGMRLGRVDIAQLIPPEFPDINLLYTFTDSPTRPSHTDCSPGRAWLCAAHRTFGSREEAVATLCADRHIYWCSVCGKPLFYRVDCPFHGRMGTNWPDFLNYDLLLLQNSKLGPRLNSKVRACLRCL